VSDGHDKTTTSWSTIDFTGNSAQPRLTVTGVDAAENRSFAPRPAIPCGSLMLTCSGPIGINSSMGARHVPVFVRFTTLCQMCQPKRPIVRPFRTETG
jgi:hypothetical protein